MRKYKYVAEDILPKSNNRINNILTHLYIYLKLFMTLSNACSNSSTLLYVNYLSSDVGEALTSIPVVDSYHVILENLIRFAYHDGPLKYIIQG